MVIVNFDDIGNCYTQIECFGGQLDSHILIFSKRAMEVSIFFIISLYRLFT
jgi:hypothetical protein